MTRRFGSHANAYPVISSDGEVNGEGGKTMQVFDDEARRTVSLSLSLWRTLSCYLRDGQMVQMSVVGNKGDNYNLLLPRLV